MKNLTEEQLRSNVQVTVKADMLFFTKISQMKEEWGPISKSVFSASTLKYNLKFVKQ